MATNDDPFHYRRTAMEKLLPPNGMHPGAVGKPIKRILKTSDIPVITPKKIKKRGPAKGNAADEDAG